MVDMRVPLYFVQLYVAAWNSKHDYNYQNNVYSHYEGYLEYTVVGYAT